MQSHAGVCRPWLSCRPKSHSLRLATAPQRLSAGDKTWGRLAGTIIVPACANLHSELLVAERQDLPWPRRSEYLLADFNVSDFVRMAWPVYVSNSVVTGWHNVEKFDVCFNELLTTCCRLSRRWGRTT